MKNWLTALFLAVSALAMASPVAAQGVGYKTLETPQPTNTGNRIEVIEFFGYFCSHCHSLDPQLKQWAKKQGNNIVFKRAHVGFGDRTLAQQKMFYALDAMGQLEQLHPRIFQAIHKESKALRRDQEVFDFIAANGVDRARFIEVYNSPAIAALTRAAVELQQLFKVEGVPMIAIDGRFLTSLSDVAASSFRQNMSEAELQAATLNVMDTLVARAKHEKGLAGKSGK